MKIFQAALSCFSPSRKTTPAITSASSAAPFRARQRFDADPISLNTMVKLASLVPLPLVFSVRSRTVANTLSITFVVRRCSQCSAEKSEKGSSPVRSFQALRRLRLPRLAGLHKLAERLLSLRTPRSQVDDRPRSLALGCTLAGNLSRMLAVLGTQQRCSRAVGYTCRSAFPKPRPGRGRRETVGTRRRGDTDQGRGHERLLPRLRGAGRRGGPADRQAGAPAGASSTVALCSLADPPCRGGANLARVAACQTGGPTDRTPEGRLVGGLSGKLTRSGARRPPRAAPRC